MTDASPPVSDRFTHLRAYAAKQKQATIDRLKQAILQLESDGHPITTFTVKEISGLDYMAYYRNPEALSLFRQHSTYLRKVREKEQAKRRRSQRKSTRNEDTLHQVKVEPRDPLLAYKKPELVAKLRAALTSREQIQQRYHTLLQEHMQCGVAIAKLEAQCAEYLAFMERFRSSLKQEEYDQKE